MLIDLELTFDVAVDLPPEQVGNFVDYVRNSFYGQAVVGLSELDEEVLVSFDVRDATLRGTTPSAV